MNDQFLFVATRPAFIRAVMTPLFASLMVSSCALPDGDFPSLKRRAIEDLPTDDQPAAKVVDPASVIAIPAAMRQNIAELLNQAGTAHNAFQNALPGARRKVAAGKSAGKNSENWVVAQSEISALSIHNDRTVEALTALDTLYLIQSEAQYSRDPGYDLAPLTQARTQVQDIVASQQLILASLENQLR